MDGVTPDRDPWFVFNPTEDDMYIVFDVTLDVQGWLDDP
jgi:hypothetical protein